MFIAKEKIKSNIGEYIIYMFQIEDLIRASKFNREWIENNIINQYSDNDLQKQEIKDWYFGLADLMEEEKIQEKGHLSFLQNKINEVFEFHLFMLQSPKHSDYVTIYNNTKEELQELNKLQQNNNNNIVMIITSALYGYHLLKMQNKTITQSTTNAMVKLATLLNKLSEKFRTYELGEKKVF